MGNVHVPESPSNVTASPAGDTTLSLAWDAPWFAGSSPVTGYEVTVADASGASRTIPSRGDRTTLTVTGLSVGQRYDVSVVARNDQGVSPPSPPVSVSMDFSPVTAVKDAAESVRARVWGSLRSSLSAQRPTGEAAAAAREHYREATQRASDDFEAMRSYRRDEETTWVPPTDQ